MMPQIDYNILCDATDALCKAVHEHPQEASIGGGVTIRGFTSEQIQQAAEFAVRLGLLYIIPDHKY